jgi:hypothetical protein
LQLDKEPTKERTSAVASKDKIPVSKIPIPHRHQLFIRAISNEHHRDREAIAEEHGNEEAKGYLNKVSKLSEATHANARDEDEVDSPQHHHRQGEKIL